MSSEPEDTNGAKRARANRPRPGAASVARPRLDDVARLAGVSTATVSRVLNKQEIVTPKLQQAVMSAVDQLGYVPHGAARALALRRSYTIGAIIPTIDNAIFANTVMSLQSWLYQAGYTLLLATSDYDYEHERNKINSLVERGIDGLVLVGEERDPSLYQLLVDKGIPYVNIFIYHAQSPHPCVGFDNYSAGHRIASYLLDIGHRHIAMIAGITDTNDRARERVEGVRAAMSAYGTELRPGELIERPYVIQEGRRAASTLLATDVPPTAIICGEDILAMGVLFECRARNIEVPQQLSITGVDDLEIVANLDPPLTTVRIPSAEMGRGAADYLLARLGDTPVADKTELEATVVIRETTAAPRTSASIVQRLQGSYRPPSRQS